MIDIFETFLGIPYDGSPVYLSLVGIFSVLVFNFFVDLIKYLLYYIIRR